MQRFENKTTLITGGSSGIGLAGARRLVEEGARVIITGRTEERLQAAAAELGDNAIAVLDNVSDGKTLERLIPVVEKVGSLDGLWLNAAYAVGALLEETDKATIEDMFQVNVVAPMLQMGALSSFLNTRGVGTCYLIERGVRGAAGGCAVFRQQGRYSRGGTQLGVGTRTAQYSGEYPGTGADYQQLALRSS